MTRWLPTDLDVVFALQDRTNAVENLSSLAADCWREPIAIPGNTDPVIEAARVATTDRFLLVNGTHSVDVASIRDADIVDSDNADLMFAFDARNAVNDLTHEVGVTCWSRPQVLAGHHTKARMVRLGRISGVDRFNTNPESAFIRGYQGAGLLSIEARPDADEFMAVWVAMTAHQKSWLMIWLSVGVDRPFGVWTIIGARRALVDLWVQKTTEAHQVADASYVAARFQRVSEMSPNACASRLGHILNPLGLEVPALDLTQSRFFRAAYIEQGRP